MEKELILISEYCEKSNADFEFILLLESEGLIEVEMQNDLKYLPTRQLNDIEMFSRLHQDLAINIEGIDVINNLLKKMKTMEQELLTLKRQLNNETFFSKDFFEEF